ncbi:minor capsid protein [Staphylococcus felis]|uniref:Minor capsid protein n=1 Tax=Staphylococcus felis TaxID=46127 RepID=A0A3E0IEQ0_9STAP|nr:minor capsid protein [Staphylococcus felis]REH81341.1 minor capsid protein [Staphylococcus felis]REH82306.1 minor capsid protein [Staphylococcus felis]REH87838.1 minor capsid protein [Staphylococcus felis]REH88999.1 minor capsid protein [Staphylococcus felis]REI15180.1 minor capsid protein [Staphylococcus felis]
MIEQALKNFIRDHLDYDMLYTMNFSTKNDNVVTVYSNGGDKPSSYDGVLIEPSYQILVKSSDFEKAYNVSQSIFKLLHRQSDLLMKVVFNDVQVDYKVYLIESSLPILLGVDEDDVMTYSINIKTHIREINY